MPLPHHPLRLPCAQDASPPGDSMADQLSPLECRVLALAGSDPLWSIARPGRLARWLLGRPAGHQPLADPRLEALRCYGILARHPAGHPAMAAARERLQALGFSTRKLEAVQRLLERGAGGMPALGGLLLAAAAFVPAQAEAQVRPPLDTSVEAGHDGPPNGPGDDNHIAIGIGATYQPGYVGSNRYRFQPLPAIDIKQGRFFLNFQDGIGLNLVENDRFTIGGGIVMVDNYRRQDAPPGVGRVPFGAGARGFVKYRLAGFEAVVGATQGFAGGTKGLVVDASLSHPIMVSQRLMLNPTVGTSWANGKHLNRYFGIDARQSADSGLRMFRPGGGFVDLKAEVSAMYRLTDHVSLGLSGGVTSLVGEVRNSPMVKARTRPYGIFFVSYSF